MRVLLLLTLFATVTLAQDSGPIRGDPRNAKPDPRALGALGGEGIPLTGDAAATAGLRPGALGIRVTSLIPRGAGDEAGLRVGDVIVAVARRGFREGDEPFLALAERLELPRKDGVPAEVRVVRDGESVTLEVLVPGTVKHPRTCPVGCERCQEILAGALAALAGMQRDDGSFPTELGGTNGTVAVTTLAGMAFFAAGSTTHDGEYAEVVKKAADWLVANAGQERSDMGAAGGKNWSQVNWALGYAPLFLAHVQATDPSDAVKEKLVQIRDAILANMEPTGGWAHGPRNEYPYPLDYAELVAVGNLCLAALGEIDSLGIEVPAEALVKASDYLEKSSDGGGGVGSSTRPGQQGMGSAGRTAGALFALSRCNLERRPFFAKLAGYYRRNLDQIPHGHVSPAYHLFFGALAARALGEKDWRAFMDAFRMELLSLHNGDGTFGVRPADTSRFGMPNTDRTMGVAWRTATYALILALADGRLDHPAGPEK